MPDIKDLIERSKVLTLIEEIRVSPHWSGAVTDMLTDVIAGEVRELPAASALSRLEKENVDKDASIEALEKALRPFAEFGENTNADSWASNIHKEPISTWFGPSDFRRAHEAIAAFDEGTK